MGNWDDLETDLGKARGLLDDADSTAFGNMELLLDRAAEHVQKAHAQVSELHSETLRLAALLRELHSMVWGECPSLLNEDSGGSARLDSEIRAALSHATGDEG